MEVDESTPTVILSSPADWSYYWPMSGEEKREKVDGRVVRARRRREETKHQILQTASRCFSRTGYHATSIQHIIEETGIARGTFYLHFQSKKQLDSQDFLHTSSIVFS